MDIICRGGFCVPFVLTAAAVVRHTQRRTYKTLGKNNNYIPEATNALQGSMIHFIKKCKRCSAVIQHDSSGNTLQNIKLIFLYALKDFFSKINVNIKRVLALLLELFSSYNNKRTLLLFSKNRKPEPKMVSPRPRIIRCKHFLTMQKITNTAGNR